MPDAEQDQGATFIRQNEMGFVSCLKARFLCLTDYIPVRFLPPGAPDFVSPLKSLFVIEGARNVFLETVKRGEYGSFDDPVNFDHKDATSTVILRLYGAYGGHAQVKLVISFAGASGRHNELAGG